MQRGSRPSQKKSSSRRKRPTTRERTTLIVLLAAIAVLLGVIVALLPETAGDDETLAVGEAQTGGPAGADDEADRPTDGGLDGRPGTGTAGGEGEQPAGGDDGAVTEAYPDGEAPPDDAARDAAPAAGADGAAGERPWWLPGSAPPPGERGPLVLVLDDAGNSLEGFDAFLDLPFPFAVAVLPQLDYSVRAAAMASAAGKEILLHLPMEAESGSDPGPGAILTGLTADEIASRVGDDLASVPGAIGVNNHMGSKATADEAVMRSVLDTLHERDLFFLDSRTSAATTGRAVAAEVGIPFAERAVFLDHQRTRQAILGSLGHALEKSAGGEPVVMIGHVTVPLLAEILGETHETITGAGYEFAHLSTLVEPVRVASGETE